MNAREADDVTVVTDERHEDRAVINVAHGNFTTSLRLSDEELRRLRGAIDAYLTTPPADDVREPLIDELSATVEWLKRTRNLIDADRVMRAIAVLRGGRARERS